MLDKNRAIVLPFTIKMHYKIRDCLLMVISPTDPPRAGAHHHREKVRAALPALIFAAVSGHFRYRTPAITLLDCPRTSVRRRRPACAGRSLCFPYRMVMNSVL